MSASSTLVTAQHFQYLAERTVREDSFLKELKTAARDAGIPPIWIAPEQASFMQIQLKLIGAERVLEVGTLAGYSAIAMARALPERGKVRTIEINPKFADFTDEWVAKSDVAGKVEVYRGSGSDVLPTMEDESVDAAFLDADKTNYPFYLEESLRIVRPGGLIMVDNAFAFGELFLDNPQDPETESVKAFNDHIVKIKELHGVIVPLGDGLWVCVNQGG